MSPKKQPVKIKLDPHFLSTYSRIALSEWKSLTTLIRLHSKYIKELSVQSHSTPHEAQAIANEDFNKSSGNFDFKKENVDDHDEFNYEINDSEEEEEKTEFELGLEEDFAATFGSQFDNEFESSEQDSQFSFSTQSEPKEEKILPTLLTVKQIQTTLEGPYHQFIKIMLTAYAKVARLRYEKYINKENIYKDQRARLAADLIISETVINRITFAGLKQAQEKLDEFTLEFHEAWQQFYSDIIDHMVEKLKHDHFNFTEYEIKELHDEEPLTELLSRFIELNIKPPVHHMPINFIQYLSLKLHLTLNNSLSRQHLPHSDSDIQQILKKYKSDFNQISKNEKNLIQQQQKLVTEVLKTL